ncbi:MAG: DUF488 domain-containing protein [Pseudomonadota bacterium]|nr:DUF488 domain-containing protein [Pseudomonadota bacterium]
MFPGSRRHPQYAEATLSATLAGHGIAYRWLPALGGRRRPLPDSPNVVWRNASFEATPTISAAPNFPRAWTSCSNFAGACAPRSVLEAVWWRCHHALIADVLCVRGIEVVHILDAGHTVVHPYTSPARIVEGRLSYVPAQGEG